MSTTESLAVQGFSSQALDQMSRTMKRQTTTEIEQVVKRAMVANAHEEARAYLTQTALQNAAMLSAMEEHCCQMAPLGTVRYQAIVDAWVIGASSRLMKW